jgi:hypothetical protein
MLYEKDAGGTRIIQPDTNVIKAIEGGGSVRVIGIILSLAGIALVWSALSKVSYPNLIFGILLALVGAALATQRYVTILDRNQGKWQRGGDIYFLISFKTHGYLELTGPVRITRLASNPREDNRGASIATYPVSVRARKADGVETELQFGKYWSLEEAREISGILSGFLDKPAQDES